MPLFLKSFFRAGWGVYMWFVFVSVVLTTTLLVAVTPGLGVRRGMARAAARIIFACCGIRLKVTGLEHMPMKPCVVVANHASYLDGVILTAALPPRFSFVIKKEMSSMPVARLLLSRLGSEFVERSDLHKGASDARRILRKASGGDAFAFFPEGTFREQPGLGRFHSGAFVSASRGKMPVVPVVIRGSREILPARRLLPWRRPLEVLITDPIDREPSGEPLSSRELRDASRERIRRLLDEPLLDEYIRTPSN